MLHENLYAQSRVRMGVSVTSLQSSPLSEMMMGGGVGYNVIDARVQWAEHPPDHSHMAKIGRKSSMSSKD